MDTPQQQPDFEKTGGLIPAIVQDVDSGRVLMLGYMDAAAYQATQDSGKATFYSRSRQALWTKGETSGNYISVLSLHLDCDQDTILVQGRPKGPVCHLGTATCFWEDNPASPQFLEQLESVLQQRKAQPDPHSHTSQMFQQGLDRIAQKFGEEAIELVLEAKNDDPEKFKNEAADLFYRLLTLFVEKDIPLESVMAVLQDRHQPK
jgi:phosphoribosyl-ATP pyrophosphohydrolase/phosphoribosyl-AMP cyclohydrolase